MEQVVSLLLEFTPVSPYSLNLNEYKVACLCFNLVALFACSEVSWHSGCGVDAQHAVLGLVGNLALADKHYALPILDASTELLPPARSRPGNRVFVHQGPIGI